MAISVPLAVLILHEHGGPIGNPVHDARVGNVLVSECDSIPASDPELLYRRLLGRDEVVRHATVAKEPSSEILKASSRAARLVPDHEFDQVYQLMLKDALHRLHAITADDPIYRDRPLNVGKGSEE